MNTSMRRLVGGLRSVPAQLCGLLWLGLLLSFVACADGPGAVQEGALAADAGTPAVAFERDVLGGEDGADTTSDATGCDCPPQMHCDAQGDCQVDVCSKGASTCADLATVKLCAPDGSAFELLPCAQGLVCSGGACWEPICEPGTVEGCADGARLQCNSIGTAWTPIPCPSGQACYDGECKAVAPNILLLIDTSGSMNFLPDGTPADECVGSGCPTWSYPNCDDSTSPMTRLGKVKQALSAVVQSSMAEKLRLAMQRFPQLPFSDSDFLGLSQLDPVCEGGYWDYDRLEPGMMSGDDGNHVTQAGGWFTKNLTEIVLWPFDTSEFTDVATFSEWFDSEEVLGATGASCFDSSSCAGQPCVGGACRAFENPELRAVGGTPLGKSLFYASEYFRHQVLMDGKPCQSATDCGSPHHACRDGVCWDPMADCRQNIVLVFTDGEETENVHITDFFHPRVQAKRLYYGLGCAGDHDCLSGANCLEGVCRPPAGEVDEQRLVCETGELPCALTQDCPDPCEAWGGCQGYCTPASVDLVDNVSNHVIDANGTPRAIRVHVIDASGVPGQNSVVAAYGGGMHISVDLADSEALLATIEQFFGDVKNATPCGP